MYVALDIETVGQPVDEEAHDKLWSYCLEVDPPKNYKKEETIEQWRRDLYNKEKNKRGLSPVTGKVIVANFAWKEHTEAEWYYETLHESHDVDEPTLLDAIDSSMCTLEPHTLYTFNGQKFDLWFLMWRYAAYSICPGYNWPWTLYDKRHCDLLDYTGMKQGSLDFWLEGIIGDKKIMNGSQVQFHYDENGMDKILEYSKDEMRKLTGFIDTLSLVFQNKLPRRYKS